MPSFTQLLKHQVVNWHSSGDVTTAAEINNGLCADFAHFIVDITPLAEIVGVYDAADIPLIPGTASDEFVEAVSLGRIGHSAIYHNGLFYDAECCNGVTCFEYLPINQRALSKLM